MSLKEVRKGTAGEDEEYVAPTVSSFEDVVVRKRVGIKSPISWTTGIAVEGRNFYGRNDLLEMLTRNVLTKGIAGIAGGPGTGKSSLLTEVARRLKITGRVAGKVKVGLSAETSDWMKSQIFEERVETKNVGRIAIVADGQPWDNKNLAADLSYLKELRDQGHFILISLYGDVTYHPGISEEVRQAYSVLLGNEIVTNKLMDDNQVRTLIRMGGKPIFSLAVEEYLINESGGHPYLAALLAGNTFHTALSIKLGWSRPRWEVFWEEVGANVIGNLGDREGRVARSVRCVCAAGFNPLTWEFNGDARLNQETYKNMLPRASSSIFKRWLVKLMNDETE